MNSKTLLGLVVAVLVLGGLGYWYMTSQSTPVQQETVIDAGKAGQTASPEAITGGATDSSTIEAGIKEVTVESNGLNFTPKEIKVKKGDKVRLTYKNNQGTHNWTLDEFNAKTKLVGAGQTETIEFIADKAGTFEYYCSVLGHRQAGMKGNLVVE